MTGVIGELGLPQSSRSRDVADHLAGIIANRSAGERLGTKEELRQQLAVAMGTMNEAVRLLQDRGLVTMKSGPKGGLFVASPDPRVNIGQLIVAIRGEPTTVREAQAIRNALEPLVFHAAIRDRTRSDIAELKKILRTMKADVDDPHAFLVTNWRLHERIAECGKDKLLTTFYLVVSGVLREQLKSIEPTPMLPQMSRQRYDVHVELVQTIIDRDEANVDDVLRRHALESG
jgi:DNA-binding FadR family transcriptional regulator